jgi:hypothetical protein
MNLWPTIKSAAHFAWSKIEAASRWTVSVASEPNGTGSASRVCFGLIVLTVCGVLIAHLWLRRSLPDQGTLLGLSSLLTAGAAGYGANKFSNKGSGDDKQG